MPVPADLCKRVGSLALLSLAISAGAAVPATVSRTHELRGVWLPAADLDQAGWERTAALLAANGFNAVFPTLAPGPQLDWCLAACRRHHVELHLCYRPWRPPPAEQAALAAAGRAQENWQSQRLPWLAPHQQANFERERDALLGLAWRYDLDGVQLEHSGYPSADSDFSHSARIAFEQWLGRPVNDWPGECRQGGLSAKWNEWRRRSIDRLWQVVSTQVHRSKPDLKLSVAAPADWDDAAQTVAEDVSEWVARGWVDFVCARDYTVVDEELTRWVTRQVDAIAGRVPLYIGLGATLHSGPEATAAQVLLSRRVGSDGFLCGELTTPVVERWLPALHATVAATPAGQAPHWAPRWRFAPPLGVPGLDGRFVVGRPVVVSLFAREKVTLALTRDGWTEALRLDVAAGPQRREQRISFLPRSPGRYRLEAAAGPSLVRSAVLEVLDPVEAKELLARQGPPQFAGHGGLRVAVWHEGYGATTLLAALRREPGLDAAPLHNLSADALAVCPVLVLAEPRREASRFREPETVDRLRRWLERGGGLLATRALIGSSGFPSLAPELAAGGEPLVGLSWRKTGNHPLTTGLPDGLLTATSTNRVAVRPGAGATVVAISEAGVPLVTAGEIGAGRYVACGLGVGLGANGADCPPSAPELRLVVNAVHWLARQ